MTERVLQRALASLLFCFFVLSSPSLAGPGGLLGFEFDLTREDGSTEKVPVTLKFQNVDTADQQLQFVEDARKTASQITGLENPSAELGYDVIVMVNDADPKALDEAVILVERLIKSGRDPRIIAANHEPLQYMADLAAKELQQEKVAKESADSTSEPGKLARLFNRMGLAAPQESTEVERTASWIMTGTRALTLLPMLAVGLSAPFSASAFAGYGIFTILTGRTFYKSRWLKNFDRLYSLADTEGKARLSSRMSRRFREGVDLFFFEAVGFLKGINTGVAMGQEKILSLWAIQTYLGQAFQEARARAYNVPASDPNYDQAIRRSAMANLNFWILMSPWPILEIFDVAPKLFSLVFVDFTGAHAALMITSVASIMLIKTNFYQRFLDWQLRIGKLIKGGFKRVFQSKVNVPTQMCSLLQVRGQLSTPELITVTASNL